MTNTEFLDPMEQARTRLLHAALPHVAFDGWADKTLNAAIAETGVDTGLARATFPRGGVDMALAFHYQGDTALQDALDSEDLSSLGMTAKITHAVRKRLELIGPEKDAVRRGATLFALPLYATDGSRAIWHTADTIWSALGDTSTDYNWYTKRATLSAVYSSTVLFWLGDDSVDHTDTWAFLDRRIANVMQFEKFKGTMRKTPFGRMAQYLSDWRQKGGPRPPMPGTVSR